ncbi:MAG TPA: hypothetical protein PKN13_01190 [Accumulibacter sp.]|nr:hypothetical protein [Accumulibacter sp.]HMW19125.1 hypothetical protein [Accumulibacter sp.]HMX23357.1 hypothetical protein [Accumulibacter sp.]HMY07591.1 hypothetical protein [Accumulibacter sp.]HNC18923.1 hypothetical protein [Accumulibacter sp.]
MEILAIAGVITSLVATRPIRQAPALKEMASHDIATNRADQRKRIVGEPFCGVLPMILPCRFPVIASATRPQTIHRFAE